jgi:hypothetical protein
MPAKKRTTTKRSSKTTTRKPKALVRRRRLPATTTALVVPSVTDTQAMAEVPDLALVGGYNLQLTKREQQVLRRPVDDNDVSIRPDGMVYLEHPACTLWLNDAFGTLGWSLTPAAKPMLYQGQIMVWYRAAVHGHPVMLVLGDLPFRETNPLVTWGKAVEGTNQIALRRFCKRLGAGGELWRKRWIARFTAAHAIRVTAREKQKNGDWIDVARWRRKDDPPLPAEKGVSPDQAPPIYNEGEHTGTTTPYENRSDDERVITGPQVKRLKTIASKLHRDITQIKAWVFRRYGYESSVVIQRRHYDEIVGAIEKNEYPDKGADDVQS